MIPFCVRKIALIAIQTYWRLSRLKTLGSLLQMSQEEKMRSWAKDRLRARRGGGADRQYSQWLSLFRRERSPLWAKAPLQGLGQVKEAAQFCVKSAILGLWRPSQVLEFQARPGCTEPEVRKSQCSLSGKKIYTNQLELSCVNTKYYFSFDFG
jgi:hypothetical protein